MSAITTLLTLDFGTGFIRVARTNLTTAQSGPFIPQMLEFNGQRRLRNAVVLTSDRCAAQAIGDDVFNPDATCDAPDLVRTWLRLDTHPVSEMGRAVQTLLARVRQTAGLENLSDDERSAWLTVVAVPSDLKHSAKADVAAVVRAAGFPAVHVIDSALAAIAWHTRDHAVPGYYLVIDCGANATRVAICQLAANAAETTILHTDSGRPAGRDFDRAIANLIRARLPVSERRAAASMVELMHFAEGFKEEFSRRWAAGASAYRASCHLPGVERVFSLSIAEFSASEVAGALMDDLGTTVGAALDGGGLTPSDVAAVVLVGGGALWPFVRDWTKTTFPDAALFSGDYPEENMVRGAAVLGTRIAAQLNPSPDSEVATSATLAGTTTTTGVALDRPAAKNRVPARGPSYQAVSSKPRKRHLANPQLAFGLELGLGLLGLLGLGWMSQTKNFGRGLLAMVAWWAVLAVVVVTAALALFQKQPLLFLFVPLIWVGVPLFSGTLARRQVLADNRRLQLPEERYDEQTPSQPAL